MAFVPGVFPGERATTPERSFGKQLLGMLSLKQMVGTAPLHQSEHYHRNHFVDRGWEEPAAQFDDGTSHEAWEPVAPEAVPFESEH